MEDVVPGDIVRLSAGDMVPADVRIVSAKDLFITQAALTGESEPVEKVAGTLEVAYHGRGTGLAIDDCTNIAFSGTTVQSGSATALVLCTGAHTYLGQRGAGDGGQARPRPASTSAWPPSPACWWRSC